MAVKTQLGSWPRDIGGTCDERGIVHQANAVSLASLANLLSNLSGPDTWLLNAVRFYDTTNSKQLCNIRSLHFSSLGVSCRLYVREIDTY
jgi:hypothetical protein